MLVLSRKPSEALVLPSLNAKITVLEIKGRSVRLGIEAPDGVRIMRSELMVSLDDGSVSINPDDKVAVNPEPVQQACLCTVASA